MRPPRISDAKMELLATRLAAVGFGCRDFLKVPAGLASLGAVGFNARPVAAAPKLAPGEKLAREQHVRLGGGGWWQNDPSSHDYNKDLYCTGVPALWDDVQPPAFPHGYQFCEDGAVWVTPDDQIVMKIGTVEGTLPGAPKVFNPVIAKQSNSRFVVAAWTRTSSGPGSGIAEMSACV